MEERTYSAKELNELASHAGMSNKVPFGAYKGELWSRVPESYLYYIVNKARKEGKSSTFAYECRQEIIGRKGNDPWANK